MKNGKKPTRSQRQLLEKNNLDTNTWLVVKHTSTEFVVVNPETNEIRSISL